MIVIFLSCLLLSAPVDRFDLDIRADPLEVNARSRGRPSHTGTGIAHLRAAISFLPGELVRGTSLLLCDAGGSPLHADFLATRRWNDGSIAVLAIHAALRANRAAGRFRLLAGRRARPPGGEAIVIRRSGRGGTVDTGMLSLTFDRRGARFFSGGSWRGRQAALLEDGIGLVVKIDGLSFRPVESNLLIEEGTARACVTFQGRLFSGEGVPGPDYSARFEFLAGSGRVTCTVQIRGGAMSGVSTGVFLALRPPWKQASAPVDIFMGTQPLSLTPGRGEEIALRSRPGCVEVVDSDGEKVAGPLAGDTRLLLKGCSPRIAVDLPLFGRLHPWSVRLCPGGELTLSALNERFQWEPAFSFRRDFRVTFFGRGRGAEPDRRPFDAGPIFGLSPETSRRAMLFASGEEGCRDDPLLLLFGQVSGRLLEGLRGGWRKWDGFMDYGDCRKSYGIWANLEFDPAYGLLSLFLRTGNPRHFAMARTMLDHWLLYDRAGKEDPDAPEGTPWQHGSDHRSGRSETGHMWIDGLLLFYLLTGEDEYRDAALKVGDIMAGQIAGLKGTRLERNVSWTLVALSALVAAGEERFRPPMNRAAAILLSKQLGCGLFGFKTARCSDRDCFEVNTWVTAGVSVEALYRHYCVTGDEGSRESAVRALSALWELGFDASKGRFCQRLFVAREGGDLVARSGRVAGGKGALLGLGTARAFRMTGEKSYRDKARAVLTRSLKQLNLNLPVFPGEDLALILRAGPDVIAALSEGKR
jgi:hypothetical protein